MQGGRSTLHRLPEIFVPLISMKRREHARTLFPSLRGVQGALCQAVVSVGAV